MLNIETIRIFALSLGEVEECLPFGPDTLVFKVGGKIFLLLSLDSVPVQFNVKCDPERAIQLREEFDHVQPGYHMNKKHWNTIVLDGTVKALQMKEYITHSYELVRGGGKKSRK